jgi:hypothetical protein
MKPWLAKRRRRRSTMSPTAPAGRATRRTGRLIAVCTSATSSASSDSEPMSHWAPTVCIQVPTFEPNWATHRTRKTLWRNGAHADAGTCSPGGGCVAKRRTVALEP